MIGKVQLFSVLYLPAFIVRGSGEGCTAKKRRIKTMDDYKEFVEGLRTAIIDHTGIDGGKVYFQKKGGRYTEKGDRLFVEFNMGKDGKEVCGLFTEELHAEHDSGRPMQDIVDAVLMELDKAVKSGYMKKAAGMYSYDKVWDALFVRPLNKEKYAEDLERAVYRTVGDIALVLYLRLGADETSITSVKVPREHVKDWDIDEESVMDAALHNTCVMDPPRFYEWEKLLSDLYYGGTGFMGDEPGLTINLGPSGNCLSTKGRTNGAVALFYPGVAQRIAELMDDDFYAVFTSIHEVMVHKSDMVEPEELAEVLRETIREATPEEDFLSFSIYRYSRETGELMIVQEGRA